MKLLVKKENQIFGKGVLHIEGCGEVIVKCVSAQRFSSTIIRLDLHKMRIYLFLSNKTISQCRWFFDLSDEI